MNLLNRVMSYDKTKVGNQESCNCVECVGINDVSEKKEIVGNFRFADDFLRKIENYRMMCREKELLTIINLKYWYKDKKTKTFIWKALHIHGDKYDYSNVKYIKSMMPVEIICRVEGHEPFPQTPSNHLTGRGCKKCGFETLATERRVTLEEFIERANETHGLGRYDYSKVNYLNMNTEVIISCPNHEKPYEFPQKPIVHLNGSGCPKCANKKRADELRITTEEFINQSNIIHNYKYDYSKVNYIDYDTEVIIICPKHGDFKQTPHGHLSGHGCQTCAREYTGLCNKSNLEEFKKNGNIVHGKGTYDYSKVNYINNQTEVIIICPIHGDFPQTPANHLQGEGCPSCRESKGEMKIRIFLTNNDIQFEREKRFEDCRHKKPLPFDFYLPRYNLCIEFDGKQHFMPTSFNFLEKENDDKKLKNLKQIQFHDQIKNEYCKNNGINLLRIRYNENIEEKLTRYFLKN